MATTFRHTRPLRYGLAALIGAAALLVVVPLFVPWDRLETRLAAIVDDAIGRALTIDGGLRLALMPRPGLVARRLTISNPDGAEVAGPMLTVERVTMEVDLLALLGGRLAFSRVVLTAPRLELVRLGDGTANWSFVGATDRRADIGADVGADISADDRAVADAAALRVGEIVIRRGALRYRNVRTWTELGIGGIAARVRARSLDGPFQVDGSFDGGSGPIAVRASIDALTEQRAIPFAASLHSGRTSIAFDGVLSGYPQRPILSGRASAATEGLFQPAANAAGDDDAGSGSGRDAPSKRPLIVETFANLSGKSLSFEQLIAQLGDQVVRGAAHIEIDRRGASIAVRVDRLALDDLAADLARDGTIGAAGLNGGTGNVARPERWPAPIALAIDIGAVTDAGLDLGAARLAREGAALAVGFETPDVDDGGDAPDRPEALEEVDPPQAPDANAATDAAARLRHVVLRLIAELGRGWVE